MTRDLTKIFYRSFDRGFQRRTRGIREERFDAFEIRWKTRRFQQFRRIRMVGARSLFANYTEKYAVARPERAYPYRCKHKKCHGGERINIRYCYLHRA